LDVYSTENEQVEALRKWWKDNGNSAIFGVVLGLAAIFGWREWQSHVITQAEAASELYQRSLIAVTQNQVQAAKDSALEIINDYNDTGYAVFARLVLAHVAAEENDYSTAEQYLREAADGTDNQSLKHEINLRLARVYIAGNKLDQALALAGTNPQGVYSAPYHELKGDILVLQNKDAEARLAYQQAMTGYQASAADLSQLNLKLDSLGK
jgi:predicted negative regulator of RcsB-dependent stress response